MEKDKRFLWIIPKNPLPAIDGARVASFMLLNGIRAQGSNVDLVILAEDGEIVDFENVREQLGVKNIFVVRREKNSHSLISFLKSFLVKPYLPVTLSKFADKLVKKKINSIVLGLWTNKQDSSCLDNFNNWQYVVYDGLHASACLEHFGKYKGYINVNTKVIYRAHNYESELWLRRAKKEINLLLRIFIFFQYLLMKRYEKSLLSRVDAIASVSSEDLNNFSKLVSLPRCQVVPIAREFKEVLINDDCSDQKNFLFVGRLDWLPNKEGLEWFLDEVWQDAIIRDPQLSLTIIGSGDGNWLLPYNSLKKINYLGQVNDLKPFYQKAIGVIVPVFYGSGTRVKVIEATNYGRACLGTELGVAGGLGLVAGEHYIRLEAAHEWLNFFSSFSSKDLYEKGRNAYYFLKEEFNIENTTKKFFDLCNTVFQKNSSEVIEGE